MQQDQIEARKAICRACDLNAKFMGVHVCKPILAKDENGEIKRGCGCVLSLKVRLASQSCPLGKWASVSIKIPSAEVKES